MDTVAFRAGTRTNKVAEMILPRVAKTTNSVHQHIAMTAAQYQREDTGAGANRLQQDLPYHHS
eukprot:COSAG06_NODE_57934_length_278_cov_1.664804_1_plen_62_part_01